MNLALIIIALYPLVIICECKGDAFLRIFEDDDRRIENMLKNARKNKVDPPKGASKEAISQWRRKLTDPDYLIAEKCYYTTDWHNQPEHHCQMVGFRVMAVNPTERKQQTMYYEIMDQDYRDKRHVEMCFYEHKFDNFVPCWGITWGSRNTGCKDNSSFRRKRICKYWRDLLEADIRRVKFCLKHFLVRDC